MHHRLATTALAVLTLALSGCFQLHALLRVNADGSGTIEETVLLKGMLAAMMQESDSTGGGLIDLDHLHARADSLGEGVRFLRVDSLDEDGSVGYRAVTPSTTSTRSTTDPTRMPSARARGATTPARKGSTCRCASPTSRAS